VCAADEAADGQGGATTTYTPNYGKVIRRRAEPSAKSKKKMERVARREKHIHGRPRTDTFREIRNNLYMCGRAAFCAATSAFCVLPRAASGRNLNGTGCTDGKNTVRTDRLMAQIVS